MKIISKKILKENKIYIKTETDLKKLSCSTPSRENILIIHFYIKYMKMINIKSLMLLSVVTLIIFPSQFILLSAQHQNDDNKSNWELISTAGFDEQNNIAPRGIEIFQDQLLIGTSNWIVNCQEKKIIQINDFFKKLDFETFLSPHWNSDGCEIWALDQGNWKEIIGETGVVKPGFGNKNNSQIGFIKKFKENLYVGTYNSITGCQVWRTKDLIDWEQVVTDGFGNNKNTWAMSATIFKQEFYVGTFNYKDGCEIYKTTDGEHWTSVVGKQSSTPNGFHTSENFYAWSMCVYQDELYVGTDSFQGCELWKTNNGKDWEPIIAYNGYINAKLNSASYACGLGKKIGSIRNMFEFNDELYLCMIGGNIYANISVLTTKNKISIPLQPNLMLSIIQKHRAASIFKYNATTKKITGIVHKSITEEEKQNQFGFGNHQNIYFWSTENINNQIFIGTLNINPFSITINNTNQDLDLTVQLPTGNAEVWMSTNGKNFHKITGSLFKNSNNIGIREMKWFNNRLYVFTSNLKTGCEVWCYSKN